MPPKASMPSLPSARRPGAGNSQTVIPRRGALLFPKMEFLARQGAGGDFAFMIRDPCRRQHFGAEPRYVHEGGAGHRYLDSKTAIELPRDSVGSAEMGMLLFHAFTMGRRLGKATSQANRIAQPPRPSEDPSIRNLHATGQPAAKPR